MKLDHTYWVKKFLYPYSLDPTPLRLSDFPMPQNLQNTNDEKFEEAASDDILETKKFQYPNSRIE